MDYVTVEQMVKEAKENLHEFSVEDVKKKLSNNNVCIIDIRDSSECIENGIIPGSFHVSRGVLEFNADPKFPPTYSLPSFGPNLPGSNPLNLLLGM